VPEARRLLGLARYAWSWCRAEGVGLTVCRALGHRRPSASTLAFQRWMADAFGRPPDHELRRPVCSRCGGFVE
jgi:hypothetical protein